MTPQGEVHPDARELHRVITASVRELLETARLEAQAGAMDVAARRAAPEYRPRDVGGLLGGASAMMPTASRVSPTDSAASKRRQDLARLLEGPGE